LKKKSWRKRKRRFNRKLKTKLKRFKKWITRDRVRLELFVDELKFVETAFLSNMIHSRPGHRGNTTFVRNLFTRGFLGIHFRGVNLIIINLAGIYRCFENWEEKLPDIISHEYLHSIIHDIGYHDGKKHEWAIKKMEFCEGIVIKKRKKPHWKVCTCKDR
jgi:hypothetical protein